MLMEVFVQNSFVLITGASSGIGRQCAIQLSEKYNLILCARREDKLLETKQMCKNSDNHLIFSYDLSDVENIETSLMGSLLIKKQVLKIWLGIMKKVWNLRKAIGISIIEKLCLIW